MTGKRLSATRRSWLRLRGLVRKESLQIVRDPSSILIAFVLPAILLLLFGFGISLDAKHVPVALVVEAPSEEAFSFAGSFMSSEYFAPRVVRDMRTAEAALIAGDVDAIVRLRANFADTVWSPQGSPIQLVVNGTDSNTARIISGYVDGAWRHWLELASLAKGRPISRPLAVEQRVWFNAEVRSRDFLVPGKRLP